MNSMRSLEPVYLGLALLGAVLPLSAFLPWLAEHGLNLQRFIQELFANRVAAFFGWDVIVSAVVILFTLAARRDGLTTAQKLGVAAGTLLVGVSVGLPLLLLFRERQLRLLPR